MKAGRSLALLITALGASACASQPPPPVSPPPPAPQQDGAQASAHRTAVTKSESFEREGRLREALWWRRVAEATAFGPSGDAGEIVRLTRLIDQAANRELEEGDKFRGLGEIPRAQAAYETALELKPSDGRARDALRALDRAAKLKAIQQGGGGGPAAPVPKKRDRSPTDEAR